MTATKFVEFPGHVDGGVFHIDATRIVCVGSHREPGKSYVWVGPDEEDCFVVAEPPAAAVARVNDALVAARPTQMTQRDEIALRFAVSEYGAKCASYYAGEANSSSDVFSGTAGDAYRMADEFLAARAGRVES